MSDPTHIEVRGARVHNLKDVDVTVPRDALVVFTGVSGSGKSSLAFDTIHQEGQRRFMESLSAYARQFLGSMERPDVDLVDGISPTLSIDQKTVNRNPRSTVGTITEIYDHLRLLYARLGTPRCPECGHGVERLTVAEIVDAVLERRDGERVVVYGPVVRERKGEYKKELDELRRDGWARARVDGVERRLDEEFSLGRYEKHTIEVAVDRLVVRASDRARLAEAVETGLRLGLGVVVLASESGDLTFSSARACPTHPDLSFPELEPRLFSFNAPQGSCPTCTGLGALEEFERSRLIHEHVPASDCFQGFNEEGRVPFMGFDRDNLADVIKGLGQKGSTPLAKWPADARRKLIDGDPDLILKETIRRDDGRIDRRERPWRGLMPLVELVWKYTSYVGYAKFRATRPCPTCQGARLNPFARAVRFRDRGVVELSSMTVRDANRFFSTLKLTEKEKGIGAVLVAELRDRLGFLDEVGLGYLTLDRSAATLSGGEGQRIRLAAQVGSALQGVTYVLDEPSIGLHPRDNARLLATLRRLRDRGNTVLVVEHDAETIEAADHVVDVGPGAGSEGGEICASLPASKFKASKAPTAAWVRGDRVIALPARRRPGNGKSIVVKGARLHNLAGVDATFPLGTLTVVTGVSGSGKSSLVFGVLEPAVEALLAKQPLPDGCDAVEGLGPANAPGAAIDKLVRISQQPIGRTPRSNPVTYTGAFDGIRALFAETQESKARGYKKGRFSFNVAGGRCEACEGAGVTTVEMQFLPSVEVVCDVCAGRRFDRETLEITYKGKTIADVLKMTVAEGRAFFQHHRALGRTFAAMDEVGLGYLPIGQPSTTLSGGEAQRIKLASELCRPASGKTLYLLDEPTTGLHWVDVERLIGALQRLVDGGNTVIVVEHHSDVVKSADHLIDLGPEGGDGGGRIVGVGTPEQLARLDTPTGRALAVLPEFREAPSLAAEPAPVRSKRTSKAAKELVLRGARKHNLAGVDVRIPHGKMTVITGPSGSGKTSLAFDTIFAEGQRQYVESLSTYARRFLSRVERAPVDHLSGLAPAIAIDQQSRSHNPRSTVATVTEIHDVLRLLWAKVGQPHCPTCGREVLARSPSLAAHHLATLGAGVGWLVAELRPVSDAVEERRDGLVRDGFARVLTLGKGGPKEIPLDEAAAVKALRAGAHLVIDRFDPAKTPAARLSEAIASAYALGAGRARFVARTGGADVVLTQRATCPDHGDVLPDELTPRHFSFNAQLGACGTCDGLGVARQLDPERVFPDRRRGFFAALDARVRTVLERSSRVSATVDALLASFGLDRDVPVARYTDDQWRAVLTGAPGPFAVTWSNSWGRTTKKVEESRAWEGVIPLLQGWSAKLDWLTHEGPCPTCRGGRLKPALLAVTVQGHGIDALARMSVEDALATVHSWRFEGASAVIAERPARELSRRLGFLVDVGLGYLSLDRAAESLSGGEAQRIRLASQLGVGLTGTLYVLDEPTIGLHPRDTERLLGTLEGLRDLGNTLVVVEHDPETMRRADHLVDLGPGAGAEGGRVLAAGPPADVARAEAGTGPWLAGKRTISVPKARRRGRSAITLTNATGNNLKGVTARFPTGSWVAVTGVSGSGKSSLVMDTLVPALTERLGTPATPLPFGALEVGEVVDRLVVVDQTPLGRTPRSTPATYTKVLDPIRTLFAETEGSRARGWTPARFSFNTPGGRCEACEGRGAVLVEMHFLPDVWVPCDVCKGRRYDRETLEVRYGGHSIADVLSMRIDAAAALFANHRGLARSLNALVDVGLGYLSLGQPATTLSGGEAQRVKLAAELVARKGHAVYVLDEPTTGLHLSDVERLVAVLHRLVDQGHTVVTVEHHLDVLRQADFLIDVGPDGGDAGGQIVATGTPEDVARCDTPTGHALRRATAP